eukprot:6179656-Lingulodinium_polyedra.AAC.1
MDIELKKDADLYYNFVKDMYEANIIQFTTQAKDWVTPFFVGKKSGRLRMVLDARVVNRRFRRCPPLSMGTGGAWRRLHLRGPPRARPGDGPATRDRLY